VRSKVQRLYGICVLFLLALTAGEARAQYPPSSCPSWWSAYGVLSGTTPADYAAANQGQAKYMAVAAAAELDNDLSQFGGAGSALDTLAANLLSGTTNSTDYAVINLGQLKALAQPFYDRLLALGYERPPLTTGTYPWVGLTPNDYAVANIGQVKNLFRFDVTYSSFGTGIPDWWAEEYFSTVSGSVPNLNPNAYVAWSGTQVTIAQAYENGWNPIDFYNGSPPTLTIVSGSGQTGSPGGFVPAPLVVSVTDSNGNPLYDAPVTFAVASGTGGSLQASSTSAAVSTITVLADSSGLASVYFELPAVESGASEITVTAGPPGEQVQNVFDEFSDDDSGSYISPFAPSDVVGSMNSDGSATITWQNNDDVSTIYVCQLVSGAWEVTGTLAAGTTTYTVSGANAVPVAIENSYDLSVGGASPDVGGGSGPAPVPGTSYFAIPVLNYAVVDMSGTLTSGSDVNMVAMDGNDNAAFEFATSDSTVSTGTWSAATGSASLAEAYNLDFTDTLNPPLPPGAGTDPVTISGGFSFGMLNPNGTGYGSFGGFFGSDQVAGPVEDYAIEFIGGTTATSGTTVFTDGGEPWLSSDFDWDGGGNDVTEYINQSNNNGYSGTIWVSWTNAEGMEMRENDGFISCGDSQVFFDGSAPNSALPPGFQVVSGPFLPGRLASNGFATGNVPDVYIGGSNIVSTLPMDSPSAINDAGEVVGSDDEGNIDIWTADSGAEPLSDSIPAPYQSEVGLTGVLALSDTDADGNFDILLTGTYQTDSNGDTAGATFLLTISSTGNNTFQQVVAPSNVGVMWWPPILNAQGLVATLGTITTGTTTSAQKALLLLPVDINIWKAGTAGPPGPWPNNGVVVTDTDTLTFCLTGTSQPNYPLPTGQPVWNYRQLMMSGSYTGWQQFGTGTKFDYPPTTSGIFQVEAVFFGDTNNAAYYVRKQDELKTSDGYMGPGRMGQPDSFGVCDTQIQINIRNEANSYLGSTAYAENVTVPAEFGFSAYGTAGNAIIRCNLFVADCSCAVSATVPAINGIFHHYPPVANQWAGVQSTSHVAGYFTTGIAWWPLLSAGTLPNGEFPQPGFIIAHPDTSDAGHCAIIDYDGGGIGAGVSGTVNKNYKYFYDGTSAVRTYQP